MALQLSLRRVYSMALQQSWKWRSMHSTGSEHVGISFPGGGRVGSQTHNANHAGKLGQMKRHSWVTLSCCQPPRVQDQELAWSSTKVLKRVAEPNWTSIIFDHLLTPRHLLTHYWPPVILLPPLDSPINTRESLYIHLGNPALDWHISTNWPHPTA